MAYTTLKRQWWSFYRCTPGIDVRAGFFGRFPVRTANRDTEEATRALEQGHIGAGYVPTPGGYIGSKRSCPAGIGGRVCQSSGKNCSMHNYCIAIDVEYQYNRLSPHYPKRHTTAQIFIRDTHLHKYTQEVVAAIEGIKNKDGEQLWKWLGWIGDYMHWELDVPPERATVDWNTVPNGVPPVRKPTDLEVIYMLPALRKGDGLVSRAYGDRAFLSAEVAAYQAALRVEGYVEDGTSLDPVCGIDSNFWDGLEATTKRFQRDHNLTVDGVAGKQTYKALFG
ncbi:hypothetical protein LCGC14_1303550 [marine sediment metagenome]|uniref:Peptidoglycan binding-like domain-containing protein n=1 Tax=marine sediment metagenome TaxID=412755 RepID=A0A0F9NRV8_9ZZZZ